MKLGFRTHAGHDIGFGHLRRCLTLAQVSGEECVFFVNEEAYGHTGPYEARPWTREHGCDVVIVDNYMLDGDEVRGCMVLDDPRDRRLEQARWIVNAATTERYPSDAMQLLGPRFAIVRDEFRGSPRVFGAVKRVLVTMGGADPGNVTRQLVDRLRGYTLEVVIGPMFAEQGVRGHRGLTSLAPLMHACDVAVSAGGQTLFELAAIGLPTLALELADNQRRNMLQLEEAGVLKRVTVASVRETLDALTVETLQQMHERALALVDGFGAKRVVEALR